MDLQEALDLVHDIREEFPHICVYNNIYNGDQCFLSVQRKSFQTPGNYPMFILNSRYSYESFLMARAIFAPADQPIEVERFIDDPSLRAIIEEKLHALIPYELAAKIYVEATDQEILAARAQGVTFYCLIKGFYEMHPELISLGILYSFSDEVVWDEPDGAIDELAVEMQRSCSRPYRKADAVRVSRELLQQAEAVAYWTKKHGRPS